MERLLNEIKNVYEINGILKGLRKFFDTDVTKEVGCRIDALKKLKCSILKHEQEIYDALSTDLGKHSYEAYISEIGMVLSEINYALRHLKKWAKPKRVKTPLAHAISRSRIYSEPYGIVLIMSPWNYPFMLTLAPLIGAVAAGNCVLIKPSEYSIESSKVINNIITDAFCAEHVSVVTGDVEVSKSVIKEKYDYIFFTGSSAVGKIVMQEAAKTLTPVTLELGGKSPCIVDSTANVDLAAKRIVWGKFLNAGQTCVAPDHVYVHKNIKEKFISSAIKYIEQFYGNKPETHDSFAKIINQTHFNRLSNYLLSGKVIYGGTKNIENLKIAPTLLSDISGNEPVMNEEIFGPILPLIEFTDLEKVISEIKLKPRPLALYIFSTNKINQEKVLNSISFGGGCINDTIVHLASSKMPFGGVGESGIGSYHGKFSFDTFSHKKSILKKSNLVDVPLRYPPFNNRIKIVKMILK